MFSFLFVCHLIFPKQDFLVESLQFAWAEQVRKILNLSHFLVTIGEITSTHLKEMEETLRHYKIYIRHYKVHKLYDQIQNNLILACVIGNLFIIKTDCPYK